VTAELAFKKVTPILSISVSLFLRITSVRWVDSYLTSD